MLFLHDSVLCVDLCSLINKRMNKKEKIFSHTLGIQITPTTGTSQKIRQDVIDCTHNNNNNSHHLNLIELHSTRGKMYVVFVHSFSLFTQLHDETTQIG